MARKRTQRSKSGRETNSRLPGILLQEALGNAERLGAVWEDEAEEFICGTCDMEEKPCVDDPALDCSEKILGGTHLRAARERSRLIGNGNAPRCLQCGKKLGSAHLKKQPLSELCPSCRGTARWINLPRRRPLKHDKGPRP